MGSASQGSKVLEGGTPEDRACCLGSASCGRKVYCPSGECLFPASRDGLIATCLKGLQALSRGLALGTGVGCREKEQKARAQRQSVRERLLLPWRELQGILGSAFGFQRGRGRTGGW